METRELAAYLLLAVIAAVLFVAYRYATRGRRAHRRASKLALRSRRERVAASCS
jgi:hypothetical protein